MEGRATDEDSQVMPIAPLLLLRSTSIVRNNAGVGRWTSAEYQDTLKLLLRSLVLQGTGKHRYESEQCCTR
jgi:hypothetical protein